ncbi:MAG: lysylphosphatidylglycerol synthase domain-containing protein, partial [Dehalococcoidia bacterium]|nr:lysylphosphatidylglycerol synthase domain-containing protein [Dehalococcoidia bacterium]
MAISRPGETGKGRGHRKLVLGALVSAALIFAATRFADLSQTAQRFDDFQWGYLPLVLVAVLAYYLLKGVRWHLFLQTVGITLP